MQVSAEKKTEDGMASVDRAMRIVEVMDEMEEILGLADAEGRDLTAEEAAQYDRLACQVADLRDGEGE
jgi:hypothetical protein